MTAVYNGTTNNWSATGAWAGAAVPTAADPVLIGTGTGGSTTGTLTIDGTSGTPSKARSIDCTSFAGTLSHGASTVLAVGDASGGSLKFVGTMTYAPNAAAQIQFVSTTTGNTIDCGGKNLPPVVFNGVGGGWQLLSNMSESSSSGTVTLTAGALDMNGFNVTGQFSRSGTATSSLTFGSGTWTMGGSSRTFDASASTGLTISCASGKIKSSLTSTATLKLSGFTWGTIEGSATASSIVALSGSPTIGTLKLYGGTSATFTAGTSTTISTSAGVQISGTAGNLVTIASTSAGSSFNLSVASGIVSVDYVALKDCHAVGGATFYAGAHSTDNGGNTGWVFTAPPSFIPDWANASKSIGCGINVS